MKTLACQIDYLTIRLTNTTLSIEKAFGMLNEVFCYEGSKLEIFETPRRRCFFNKETGTDFKISKREIILEFHGTFLSLFGYDTFKVLKRKVQEAFGTFARITEIHIAQDFTGLSVDSFFPKDPSVLETQFKALREPKFNQKTKRLETIYLKGSKNRWQICIYDKTKELRDNFSKSNPAKIDHYKNLGYFDKEVTRVELKLRSEFCKNLIETFETDKCEIEICNIVLNFYFQKHRIYKLKRNEKFDMNHVSRHIIWPTWEKLFARKEQSIVPTKLSKDCSFKLSHTTNLEDVVTKITNYSLKYNCDPKSLIEAVIKNKLKIIHEAEDQLEKSRKTQEYLQSLANKAA